MFFYSCKCCLYSSLLFPNWTAIKVHFRHAFIRHATSWENRGNEVVTWLSLSDTVQLRLLKLNWLFFRNWIMDMQIMFWQVHRQWWIQGRGLGGRGPPIFRNKLRAKVIFGGTAPDGSGTGRNVHIYTAVWIFLGYYHFKLK